LVLYSNFLPSSDERADVVHDLLAEVVLAALGDVDLLLDRTHQPLVRLLVFAGVGVRTFSFWV
jgi:hypothetical protein